MAVSMCFDDRLLGDEFLQHINQLFEPRIAGEELFDLGAKFRTFPSCLLVRKYVKVVLHDVFLMSFGRIIPSNNSVFASLRVDYS